MKTTLRISPKILHPHRAPKLCALAGAGTFTLAAWLIFHGRRNAGLLVAQWSAPLLLTALHNKLR